MHAITGITGQVGGQLAERLLDQGAAVRAVVRDPQRAARWQARGCDVTPAAMHDASALASAFAGAQAVFVLLPPVFDPEPGFPETRRHVDALSAALQASQRGTPGQRVVCVSTIGAQAREPNLLSQLGLMEQQLGALDLPIAFLRAAWFMENLAWDVEVARSTGVLHSFLQPAGRAVPMVATADVAQAAASLLGERWQGRRIVELQGPELVSPDEQARALARALGRPVRVQTVPREQWETRFRADGMRNPQPRMRMLDGFNEGWIAFEQSQAEVLRGTTSLQHVVDRLAAPVHLSV